MYDLKMLEEIKSQEERIHFSSFDYNDAYTLGTMLRERGLTTPKPIAIRIVFDDIILYFAACINYGLHFTFKILRGMTDLKNTS